jgi:hypothetical protein
MPSSEVFSKYKAGKLRSGGSGKKVTNHAQAVAIFMSEKDNEAKHGGEYVSAPDASPRDNPVKNARKRKK